MRRIVKSLLKELEFTNVDEAEDGMVAMTMLNSNRYDVVLVNLNMPSMSGIELLSTIRHDVGLKHLPVLMIAVGATQADIAEAIRVGVSGYITYPLTCSILQAHFDALAWESSPCPQQSPVENTGT